MPREDGDGTRAVSSSEKKKDTYIAIRRLAHKRRPPELRREAWRLSLRGARCQGAENSEENGAERRKRVEFGLETPVSANNKRRDLRGSYSGGDHLERGIQH